MKRLPLALVAGALAAALAAGTAHAAPAAPAARPERPAALRGVKDGKGVFLVDLDDGRKMAMYLKIIAGTRQRLERQGVRADLKLVFIGPSVKFLRGEAAPDASPADRAVLAEVAEGARELAAQGVALEVCAIATDVFGVDRTKLIPGTTVIDDGFVSLIGYQAQGYRLVPIY